MLDPRNVGTITAGLVAEPEVIDTANTKIIKFRLAVPYAGTEKGSDDRRGFFDATYFTNDGDQNSKFVLGQIAAGNFKPGTMLQFLYRLNHERWTTEDKKNSRVVLVAESIAYAGNAPRESSGADDEAAGAVTPATKF